MRGKARMGLIVLLACLVLCGLAARADMPAQNHYWVKVDAILGAASVFPPGEAAAFKSGLEKAVTGDLRTMVGIDASFKKVEEYALFAAFENLIKPSVEKGDLQKVNGFLDAVSNGKWIRGQLVARNGGDFVVTLGVVAGEDGSFLLRQSNKAVHPAGWEGTTFDRSLGVSVKKADATIFKNSNTQGVSNGPTAPTTFTISQPHTITSILNYHWNGGKGQKGGNISLRSSGGTVYGPWKVTTSGGQGAAPDVNWLAEPGVVIPAGTYTVVDSDPATWSQNPQSRGQGFSEVKGRPQGGAAPPQCPPGKSLLR